MVFWTGRRWAWVCGGGALWGRVIDCWGGGLGGLAGGVFFSKTKSVDICVCIVLYNYRAVSAT